MLDEELNHRREATENGYDCDGYSCVIDRCHFLCSISSIAASTASTTMSPADLRARYDLMAALSAGMQQRPPRVSRAVFTVLLVCVEVNIKNACTG